MIRWIVILGGISLIINGCNNILSGVVGTHKLKHFEIQEVVENGIGDSDFIAIDAMETPDSFFILGSNHFLQQPLLVSPIYLQHSDQRMLVGLVWTDAFDASCANKGDCHLNFAGEIKGLVHSKYRIRQWAKEKYENSTDLVFVEHRHYPIPWYWNVAMVVGAILLIYLMERRNLNHQSS